ncbi:MAG TPA: cyclic nucleotide-binding domain-containing protein [bacterium]|nr:cyclic nucleotide-binding domain-containing protein [bacterium]
MKLAKRAHKKTDHTILKKLGILSALTNDEIEVFHRIATRTEVRNGAVIMREGDVGDSMFLFAEGEVTVTKNLTLRAGKKGFSQAEKSMVRLNAEFVSFFGDMAMFENDVRSATITAQSNCLIYEIKRDDFNRIGATNPAVCLKVILKIASVLCHRVRQGNQDVLKLTTALSIALSK